MLVPYGYPAWLSLLWTISYAETYHIVYIIVPYCKAMVQLSRSTDVVSVDSRVRVLGFLQTGIDIQYYRLLTSGPGSTQVVLP